MAVVVIISGFGALNGWTMICAEMPLAAANDGLFPKRFKPLAKGVPAFGIVTSTALASIAMSINYIGSTGCNGLHHPGADDRDHRGHPVRLLRPGPDQVALGRPPGVDTPRFVRDLVVAVVSLVFSVLFIWYSRFTGERVLLGLLGAVLPQAGALLLGIPVYLAMRDHMTEPEPVPEYR